MTLRPKIHDKMDSLKHPATAISAANSAAIIALAIWLTKKNSNLGEEIDKLADHMGATIKKVSDSQIFGQHIAQLAEAMKGINRMVSLHGKELEFARRTIINQDVVIKELTKVVKSLGCDVNLPDSSQQMNYQRQWNHPPDSEWSRRNPTSHPWPKSNVDPNNYSEDSWGASSRNTRDSRHWYRDVDPVNDTYHDSEEFYPTDDLSSHIEALKTRRTDIDSNARRFDLSSNQDRERKKARNSSMRSNLNDLGL